MLPINEPGTYQCRVAAQTTHDPYFQTRGKDQVDCVCLVFETLDADQFIKGFWYLSPNAAPYTKKKFNEVFGDDWIDKVDSGEDPFAGVEVEIVTEVEYYKEKPQIRIKWLNKPGGGSGEAMDSRKVSAVLNALKKAKLPEQATQQRQAPAPSGPRRSVSMGDLAGPGLSRPQRPAVATEADDDVPF